MIDGGRSADDALSTFMAETSYSLGLGFSGNLGVSTINAVSAEDPTTSEVPYAGNLSGNANGSIAFGDLELTGNVALWGGLDDFHAEQTHQTTPVRGIVSRLAVWQDRSSISPHFGINDLSLTAGYDPIGLSLKLAAFTPIEALGYPYIHAYNGDGLAILENSGFDTAAPADVYNPKFGPTAAAIFNSKKWTGNHQFEGVFQLGTAGTDPFDFGVGFQNARLTYSYADPAIISASIYGTWMDPVEKTSEFGEKVSRKKGYGTSVVLNAGPFRANAAFSTNSQEKIKEVNGMRASLKENDALGVNVSAQCNFGPVIGALGYSWLGLENHQEAFTVQDEKADEHVLNLAAQFPFKTGPLAWAPFIGYQHVFVDGEKLFSKQDGARSVFYGGLNLALSITSEKSAEGSSE